MISNSEQEYSGAVARFGGFAAYMIWSVHDSRCHVSCLEVLAIRDRVGSR